MSTGVVPLLGVNIAQREAPRWGDSSKQGLLALAQAAVQGSYVGEPAAQCSLRAAAVHACWSWCRCASWGKLQLPPDVRVV